MVETIIVLAIVCWIAASAYSSGKRTGSRKGFNVGRWRARRR